MVFYHIDRRHSLLPNSTLQLEEIRLDKNYINLLAHNLWVYGMRTVAAFGQSMIDFDNHNGMATYQSLASTTVEHTFELVRVQMFKKCPSRMQSLFSVKSISDIAKWVPVLSCDNPWIWEVESESGRYKELDARYLMAGDYLHNMADPRQNAIKYWKSKITTDSLPEVLLPYPVRVIRRVPFDISELH